MTQEGGLRLFRELKTPNSSTPQTFARDGDGDDDDDARDGESSARASSPSW